jgi:hypothetical protein
MLYKLTWLPKVLKDAKLKVAEHPGWKTRGHGNVGTIKGVICHHTAGPPASRGNMPSLRVVAEGRKDLRGPLSQLCLGRDGTFYVVAAGKSHHAGKGDWQGFRSGNTNFIGIEAENMGLPNDPWPPEQMDAYRRGVAAILKKINQDAIMCCGHKEYALPPSIRPDPNFDMFDFRNQVSAIMKGAAPKPTMIAKEDGEGRSTLRRGNRGNSVKEIQSKVGVTITGNFDAVTEAAVRQFQREHSLLSDGIVGPRTWAMLLL